MKKAFMCSLIHKGIIGGGLYLNTDSVTYVCQKLTVDKMYKRITLPLCDINEISWQRIIFPIATFHMTNGETYKFIIFNQKRFVKWYQILAENKQ